MKALVYTGTEQMAYRDEPAPEPSEHEVLLQVQAAAICGSDMHAYHGKDERRVPPLILGHEVSGIVETGALSGQRMVINPLITCGTCRDCLSGRTNLCAQREIIGMKLAGAYAEKIRIPERNLLPIQNELNFVHAALTEPIATAMHAIALVERIRYRPLSEARCLILGGGAIGLLAALILKAKGCTQVDLAETNPLRRHSIQAQHCAEVYDPRHYSAPHEGDYDVVFDCVGAAATRQTASQAVRPGGIISHVGLQDNAAGFDARRITLQEITVLGNYCYSRDDLLASINMLEQGQLGSLDWVDVRPLSRGAEAFEDLNHGRVSAGKIVLQPDHVLA